MKPLMRRLTTIVVIVSISYIALADSIVLRDGKTIEGTIVGMAGNRLAIKTAEGISTFGLDQLDPKWVNEHVHKDVSATGNKQTDVRSLLALIKRMVSTESLIRSTAFLNEHKTIALDVSGGLIVVGLLGCFFGWRLFRYGTIITAIVSGILLGLTLASVASGLLTKALGNSLSGDFNRWVHIGLFMLIGIPCCIVCTKVCRRLAMFDARLRTLDGLGSGWLGSLFALSRFAFLELSVIWGHALGGAILIGIGGYCATVLIVGVSDERLQSTLATSFVTGAVLCVVGAVTQMRNLRSESAQHYDDKRGGKLSTTG
jgi:hypothetical protein